MSPRPSDDRSRSEHGVVIFFVVAAVMLGTLLLLARIVSAGEDRRLEPTLTIETVAPAVEASTSDAPPAQPPQPAETLEALSRPPLEVAPPAEAAPAQPPPAPAAPVVLPPAAPAPAVNATAFAIYERNCDTFVYGRNDRMRLPPASLTKIVTALVVRERGTPLQDMAPVDVSAKEMLTKGSSVMGLEPGMHVSVLDLLYGLFLPSGNDAALTLAEYVGQGNVERFVGLMNDEAARLGLTDTHFTNPHGLDNPDLYSSAHDLVIAGNALLADPLLAQISATPTYRVDTIALKNGNKLLNLYPGAFGVKIGFTNNAHQTIVAAAERDGRQLVLSLLGSSDRYADSTALLDWAFASIPSPCPR